MKSFLFLTGISESYTEQSVSKFAHRSDGSNDAKVTSVTLPLPLWMEQQLNVQNYAITVSTCRMPLH
jgi:hypothetical protein